MVLNGDILEYENVGPIEDALAVIVDAAIEMDQADLIMLANTIMEYYYQLYVVQPVMRMQGGGIFRRRIDRSSRRLKKGRFGYGPSGSEVMIETMRSYGKDLTYGTIIGQGLGRAGTILRKRKVPFVPNFSSNPKLARTETINNNMGNYTQPMQLRRSGSSMLTWKNSLTRMYHTYQRYYMSNIYMKTIYATGETVMNHATGEGNGPCLYWTFTTQPYLETTGTYTGRETNHDSYAYWDGGMAAKPSDASGETEAKDWGLGKSGIIYIFHADWPGTVMNPDTETQGTTTAEYNKGHPLMLSNYDTNTTLTTHSTPRLWKDVFAQTTWQYITIYGSYWKFDFTNTSSSRYVVEIQLIKFKADIDAMNYQKQCMAAFGGQPGGTNAYINKLALVPNSDTYVLKTKRFKLDGLSTMNAIGSTFNSVEGQGKNNKTISWNVKRKYVIKRPVLTEYSTTLTEKEIYTKYCDRQKSLYFRIMAWPEEMVMYMDKDQVLTQNKVEQDKQMSQTATGTSGSMCPGVTCHIYKKTNFKLDETAANF